MKTATAPLPPLRSVKVLDQLRERIRYLHYSLRTEQAYVHWVRAFIRFHGVRHPATLGSSEVEAFLSWLANERKVSVSTHRQALAALLFFYGKVLCTDLPWLQEIGRHCCKVSDEAAFCLIQRPYISKTLLTRRISP
ncbi:phage integrase N-terminal SAM-like domain-containing protein, partial [Klebsiella pneumoniae]|uniref:phage integrase N-terminal SAM-like domain-containing protein n=1 Tax=Klebsiella pneumoniae TaxID=573 RepID=UPI002169E587